MGDAEANSIIENCNNKPIRRSGSRECGGGTTRFVPQVIGGSFVERGRSPGLKLQELFEHN